MPTPLRTVKFKSTDRPYKKITQLAAVLHDPFTNTGEVLASVSLASYCTLAQRDTIEKILLAYEPITLCALALLADLPEDEVPEQAKESYKDLKESLSLLTAKPKKRAKWPMPFDRNKKKKGKK